MSMDTLSHLQTGEYSPQVTIASAALEQAKAGLEQANTAVQQAEANLALAGYPDEKAYSVFPNGWCHPYPQRGAR